MRNLQHITRRLHGHMARPTCCPQPSAPSVPYIINGATEWLPFSIRIWEAVEITVANSCCLSARLRSPAPTFESVYTWKRLYGLSKAITHVVSSCPTFVLYLFMSLDYFTSLRETPAFANGGIGVSKHIWLLISSQLHTLRWKAASVIQRQHRKVCQPVWATAESDG